MVGKLGGGIVYDGAKTLALQGAGEMLIVSGIAVAEIEIAFDEEAIDWLELAKLVAWKKFKGDPAADQKMYAKQIRFMQYRGFDFEQISYALDGIDGSKSIESD